LETRKKGMRGWEPGRWGLGWDRNARWGTAENPPLEEIQTRLATPTAERIWYVRYALKAGLSVDDIYQRTKIDRWFLNNIRELVDTEDPLRACPGLDRAGDRRSRRAKKQAFSTRDA